MDPLGLITGAMGKAKQLYEIAEKFRDADLKNAIADLRGDLADLKTEVAALKEENLRLSGELKRGQDVEAMRSTIAPRDGVYYLNPGPHGRLPGPYCPRCFESDHQLMPVHRISPTMSLVGL